MRLSLYRFAFASIWKYTDTNFFFATSEDMPLVLFQASHLDLARQGKARRVEREGGCGKQELGQRLEGRRCRGSGESVSE